VIFFNIAHTSALHTLPLAGRIREAHIRRKKNGLTSLTYTYSSFITDKSSPGDHDITISVCLGTEAREDSIAMLEPGLKNSQRTNAWPPKIAGMWYLRCEEDGATINGIRAGSK
jgi:hypothetical protein